MIKTTTLTIESKAYIITDIKTLVYVKNKIKFSTSVKQMSTERLIWSKSRQLMTIANFIVTRCGKPHSI